MNKKFIITVFSILLLTSIFLGYRIGFSDDMFRSIREAPLNRPVRIYTHSAPRGPYIPYLRRHRRWYPRFWWDNLYEDTPWGPCPGDWCPYR